MSRLIERGRESAICTAWLGVSVMVLCVIAVVVTNTVRFMLGAG